MEPVLVGMALCVVAAVVVLALVAVPRVRQGDKLLTPDGEETVRGASRRARALATQAVDRADVKGRADDARTRTAAWSPPATVKPAGARREGAGDTGTSTLTTSASPEIVQPAEQPEPPPQPQPDVIDLRDDVPRHTTPRDAALSPVAAPAARRRAQRHREAELGWGEPRPGPRHGR